MSLVPRSNLFDIDRFFSDSWPRTTTNSEMGEFFAPRVDIKEVDDHYEITAELPGIPRENIQVHVKDGILTLEAENTQEEKEEKEGKIIRQERRYGKFMRSFNLGGEVQEEDIEASFKDGVLTLQEAQEHRRRLQARRAGQRRPQQPRPEPDVADFAYGEHDLQRFDLWLAESDEPTPLILFIHGGGFRGGDKRGVRVDVLQQAL